MNISAQQVRTQHLGLGFMWRRALGQAAQPSPHVDVALLEALSSRESNMRNITGDHGHGRGAFQQDDRYQQTFLASVRGCRDGSTVPIYKSALPAGRVPTVGAGAKQCTLILEHNVSEAKRLGIPEGHRMHFALAAYNAGVGGALKGWNEDHNPDKYTAGGDYADDVMARSAVIRSLLT